MISTYVLNIPNGVYQCPFCGRDDELRHTKSTEIKKFLIWETKREVIEDIVKCNACNKSTTITRLKNAQKTTVTNSEDGVKTTEIQRVTNTQKSSRIETVTQVSYAQYIPKVDDTELYMAALFLIFRYLSLQDTSIVLDNNEFYNYLSQKYEVIQEKVTNEILKDKENIAEVKLVSLQYLKKCRHDFMLTIVQTLVRNSAQVLKGKMFIPKEIQEYYYTLFNEIDVKQFEKQRYFLAMLG